jgi:hypothetical protein
MKGTQTARYRQRLLTLLDLLGFRDLVCNASVSASEVRATFDLFKVMTQRLLRKSQMKTTEVNFNTWHFHIVSDTMTISCPCSHDDFNAMSMNAMYFQAEMLAKYGIPVRGAIVYGKIYDDEPDVIFGPALLLAQKLEKYEAKWSRILVDRTVISKMEPAELNRDTVDFLRTDDGQLYYLDYLNDLFHLLAYSDDASGFIHNVNNPLELFRVHKQSIEEAVQKVQTYGYDNAKKNGILKKYTLLDKYHNDVVDRHCSLIDEALSKNELLSAITHDSIQLRGNPDYVSWSIGRDSRYWGIAWLLTRGLQQSVVRKTDNEVTGEPEARLFLASVRDELQQDKIKTGAISNQM